MSVILSAKFIIYVMFFGFWGLCPQTPTGALPLDPTGGLPSPRPPGHPLAKIPAGAHGGPTFFSEQGPVLGKSGPEWAMPPPHTHDRPKKSCEICCRRDSVF